AEEGQRQSCRTKRDIAIGDDDLVVINAGSEAVDFHDVRYAGVENKIAGGQDASAEMAGLQLLGSRAGGSDLAELSSAAESSGGPRDWTATMKAIDDIGAGG